MDQGGKLSIRGIYRYFARLIESYWQHKKLRFLFVGGINTCVGLSVFPILFILTKKYDVHYEILLLISWIITTTFSFTTNKKLVFRSKGSILREYLSFISLHGIFLILNAAYLSVAVEYLALSPIFAQIIFSVASVVVSYLWYNNATFVDR